VRAETIIHQTFNHQKVPLALRLSGQLLLGVVRIYARKLEFLHRDSDDALLKIRQARTVTRARCAGRRALKIAQFWLVCMLLKIVCAFRQAFKGAATALPPEALTAPLGSNTVHALLDYDSLDFYADASANFQMQLECVPLLFRRRVSCAFRRAGTRPGACATRRGTTRRTGLPV
jgi:hypothetical protein